MKMLAVFNKIYIEIIIQLLMIIDFIVHQLLVRTKFEELKASTEVSYRLYVHKKLCRPTMSCLQTMGRSSSHSPH
jgi:hypothetical protein